MRHPFAQVWASEAQAVARAAAGWPAPTLRERFAAGMVYQRLRLRRHRGEIPEVFAVVGLEHATTTIDDGAAILALPHVGAYEAAASLLAEHYPAREVFVVGEDVSARSIPARLGARYGWGYLSVHDPAIAAAAMGTLERGGILVVLSDVYVPGQHSAECEFLGRQVRLPTGPAYLSITYQAPIVPCASYLEGDACRVLILPALVGAADTYEGLTQRLAQAIGSLICEEPDQWFPPRLPEYCSSEAVPLP